VALRRVASPAPTTLLRSLTTETDIEIPAERVAELKEQGAQIIDVREDYEHAAGRIPGARHIEVNDLAEEAETLDRDKPVVFYCASGDRSTMPAQALRASGFDAYTLAGGLVGWRDAGQALEPDGGEVAARRPGPRN
jgi:rhodanese-related sulfurtransferase